MIEFQKVYDLFTEVGMSDPRQFLPYINPLTNEAEWLPEPGSEAEDCYDDLEKMRKRIKTEPGWIELPDKQELGLGSRMPLRFAGECLEPEDYELVSGFFRHSGAYRNFRAYIDRLNKTEEWYQFQDDFIRKALRRWLAGNDIEFSE